MQLCCGYVSRLWFPQYHLILRPFSTKFQRAGRAVDRCLRVHQFRLKFNVAQRFFSAGAVCANDIALQNLRCVSRSASGFRKARQLQVCTRSARDTRRFKIANHVLAHWLALWRQRKLFVKPRQGFKACQNVVFGGETENSWKTSGWMVYNRPRTVSSLPPVFFHQFCSPSLEGSSGKLVKAVNECP